MPKQLREQVLTRIRSDVLIKAREDAFSAAVYWEFYENHLEELFRIHGFKMFLSDGRWFGHFPRPAGLAALSDLVFQIYFGKGREEEMRSRLRVIGRNFGDAPKFENTPRILKRNMEGFYAPNEVLTKIFNKVTRLDADLDEVWGLILCSVVLFDVFETSGEKHPVAKFPDLREISAFQKMARDALEKDGDQSERSLFLKAWLDRPFT
jgi:hypothetical protein